jgi:hypothetical protein
MISKFINQTIIFETFLPAIPPVEITPHRGTWSYMVVAPDEPPDPIPFPFSYQR